MKVKYKDKEMEIKKGDKISEILKEEIEKSENIVIGAKYNNEYQNLDYEIEEEGTIELIDITEKEGINIYRRTLIYIMGKAMEELYPKALMQVDYQLGDSMYCDIENQEATEEIIQNLKKKMREIIEKDIKIEKIKMTRQEAEEFFKEKKTNRGLLQLDVQENKTIYMYKCENYYNYIYGEIANRTGATQVFDVVKHQKGFLIRYPSRKSPNQLTEYDQAKKLAWAFEEYDTIHRILKVDTVYRLNKAIKEDRIKNIIMLDEALHEKKIANIADKIANRKGIKMILIAGPSSSGKTTFAQRLGLQLQLNGIKPVTISVDNYFVERWQNPKTETGEYDFECIEAIDLELFNNHLTRLLKGEEVEIPQFDFKEGTKKYCGEMLKLEEDEVLVIEGIHCLNDKLTSSIPRGQKYKIYISALTVLNMDYYNRISTTDTRLIRRIVRDNQFRGYSAKDTIKTWGLVNKGEQKNIFPFQESSDSIFNTSLIYELSAFKDVVIPLLEEIKPEDDEYPEARRLCEMLKYFEPIPNEMIPTNSLIKEFLGGGDFRY